MSLSLEQLRALIAFADGESVDEAAARIGISQPALTKRLAALQNNFGKELFVHRGKRKSLTPYGELLCESIRDKVNELYGLIENVQRRVEDPANLEITIGLRREVLGSLVSRFTFPGRITFRNMSKADAETALKRREIDFAVYQSPETSEDYVVREVMQDEVVLCGPRGMGKLSMKQVKSRTFILSHKWIIYKESAPFLSEWCDYLGIARSTLQVHRICDDWKSVVKMVEAGFGLGIVPVSTTKGVQLSLYPIAREIIAPTTFYLVCHHSMAWVADMVIE